jgi:hypothetical protein
MTLKRRLHKRWREFTSWFCGKRSDHTTLPEFLNHEPKVLLLFGARVVVSWPMAKLHLGWFNNKGHYLGLDLSWGKVLDNSRHSETVRVYNKRSTWFPVLPKDRFAPFTYVVRLTKRPRSFILKMRERLFSLFN